MKQILEFRAFPYLSDFFFFDLKKFIDRKRDRREREA